MYFLNSRIQNITSNESQRPILDSLQTLHLDFGIKLNAGSSKSARAECRIGKGEFSSKQRDDLSSGFITAKDLSALPLNVSQCFIQFSL